MFNIIISKKARTKSGDSRYLPPENVKLINIIKDNLKEYLNGKLSHSKGPDYMILLFYLDGFCDCVKVINTSRSNPGQKNK